MDPLSYQTSEIAKLYDKYADMLFRVAYTELLSKEDAEDAIIGIKPLALEKNITERSLSRMQKEMEVSLEMKESATLQVTGGYLKVHKREEQLVEAGEAIATDENTKVTWNVAGAEPCELMVTTKKCMKTYEIYQEKTSKLYYVKLKEKQKL